MAGFLANLCVLLSSCSERDSSCSSCHSAPVPCNHQIGSTTTPQPAGALIISGGNSGTSGNSVEVFVPSTGQHCQLPDIPGDPRHLHTMEGRTVCGGSSQSTWGSCLTLTDIGWETSATLLERRVGHSSWASPSGLTILIGGDGSAATTEKIQEDGTSVKSFDLKYDIRSACAINLGATVLITGGDYSLNIVSEYSEEGYLRDLPQLLQGRSDHGCSYYVNDKSTKTYLVSGGNDDFDRLSSTELLEETATSWVLAGELPSPLDDLRIATVDNRVLSTGGHGGHVYDDIQEFDPINGWTVLAKMSEARKMHAVSSIPFSNIEQFCN